MKVKKIINEEVNNYLDEDYPHSFNMEEFKSLTSFKKRKEYCNKHLWFLGQGSGRRVYIVDNNKVLKLAHNRKGVAQNEVEVSQSNDYVINGLVAETYEHHPDYLWVEAERCKKITRKRFKELVGVDFDKYIEVLQYQKEVLSPIKGFMEPPDLFNVIWEDEGENYPFIYKILSYIGDYDLPVGDLTRLSTYGENSNGEIVIIDYGLTDQVFKQHYFKQQ